ncbi:neutral zinc metallopeptidase [Sphingomonas montana]|uniref:KPN_02809 family neutral zinc metallopeptidase n=1 Tax=Sphingomonas montana TaxID=1843236 RepID=UPI00096F1EFF|nr:neutral zinc metallopeptidase [Sphingomonas montana]
MRLDDYRTSDNVEDQGSGNGGGGGFGGGGGGGGIFGLLFGIVASRFGIGGIVVLAIGAMLLGMNPLSMLGGGATSSGPRTGATTNAAEACSADAAQKFSCQVLASTEDTWAKLFAERNRQYTPAGLSFYDRSGNSGCGQAQSAMGPFYCPTDKKIYLDTAFYTELQQKFGAPGDFAQAYVIAHEVGHHVQDLEGTLAQARQAQQATSETAGNAVQVKVELQADCYAGVWAARNPGIMSPGDVQEGLTAAAAIGDDTLQGDRARPESFTHGSAAQRKQWLERGLKSGDPAQCDTFA